VVYFEHISRFEKDKMWFPTAQKHEGKRGRGKNLKEFGKEEYENFFYHCSTILHSHLT
jgi:hypothetical protein